MVQSINFIQFSYFRRDFEKSVRNGTFRYSSVPAGAACVLLTALRLIFTGWSVYHFVHVALMFVVVGVGEGEGNEKEGKGRKGRGKKAKGRGIWGVWGQDCHGVDWGPLY